MKKLSIIFIILFFSLLAIFSEEKINRFWDNSRTNQYTLKVESTISYSPSVVNFVYGKYNVFQIIGNSKTLSENNDFGFYYSDSLQWNLMFNVYPFFQVGGLINYKWLHGLQTFVFSNLYRICGFTFDVYNFTFQVAVCDIGYSWFKYEWNQSVTGRNNEWCTLISPITLAINYRIMLTEKVDIYLSLGYSMQMVLGNDIIFPNSDELASMFLEHVFNQGIGFRFYTLERR